MLFSSTEFVFVFLPLTLSGFFLASRFAGRGAALSWLVAASLFFYGWWNPWFLLFLLASVSGNYGLGLALAARPSKTLLVLGVVSNLGLIAYFKYAQFLLDLANQATGSGWSAGDIVLPLAISFFTFQQIAYLFDVREGKAREPDFLSYCLFVTFFPQLIAGPIVHHSETIPQFRRERVFHLNASDLSVGLTIFVIGLYKKIVLADGIAVYSDAVFDSALTQAPDLFAAWQGALAYTFQIYFDFSGYSDMAIGLARLVGIRLPLNFDSPYKAHNIIEFWRRWHMTLSRFLRNYLYILLGGNRRGRPRRYANVMITMLLGGLWHGAAWNFVFWGGLHGLLLVLNHAWHALRRAWGPDPSRSTTLGRWGGRVFTFFCVVVAWVFFRAENWQTATLMLEGMAGLNGAVLPAKFALDLEGSAAFLGGLGVTFGNAPPLQGDGFLWIGIMLAIVWLLPSTQEIMADHQPALGYEPGPADLRWIHLRRQKRYWLAPFIVLSMVVGGLIVLGRGPDAQQFIYMIF